MTDAYEGKTGSDYDELLDTLADVCADDDPAAVDTLYARDEFKVPFRPDPLGRAMRTDHVRSMPRDASEVG